MIHHVTVIEVINCKALLRTCSITYAYLFHLEMKAVEPWELQKEEDRAWEPKVCAFHLSNQKLIPEKFASNRDVPVNLNSLPFLAEVTE